MEIVINNCYGGFGLSDKALEHYAELAGIELVEMDKSSAFSNSKYSYSVEDSIERNDPKLVETIKALGKDANGFCSSLKVITIPDDVEWQIEEYDGREWVAEKHETWS